MNPYGAREAEYQRYLEVEKRRKAKEEELRRTAPYPGGDVNLPIGVFDPYYQWYLPYYVQYPEARERELGAAAFQQEYTPEVQLGGTLERQAQELETLQRQKEIQEQRERLERKELPFQVEYQKMLEKFPELRKQIEQQIASEFARRGLKWGSWGEYGQAGITGKALEGFWESEESLRQKYQEQVRQEEERLATTGEEIGRESFLSSLARLVKDRVLQAQRAGEPAPSIAEIIKPYVGVVDPATLRGLIAILGGGY